MKPPSSQPARHPMTPRLPIFGPRLRTTVRLSLASAFLLLPARQLPAQAQPPVKKLATAEALALEKKLDRRLLPPAASELEFQPDQAITLSGPSSLNIIPVRYQSSPASPGSPPHFQCGLFLAADNHADRFLPTFGTGWTAAESCDGLDAAGLIAGSLIPGSPATNPAVPGSPATAAQTAPPTYPAILLIYQAFTVPESFPVPVLLLWDDHAATYRLDPEQSQWLAQQKDGRTIPGARRLLATRNHRPGEIDPRP